MGTLKTELYYFFYCYETSPRVFVLGGYEISSVEEKFQRDLIVLSVYAIVIIPMLLTALEIMSTFPDNTVKKSAYADNFVTEGSIKCFKHCCDTFCNLGPKFGYYLEAKSWLIVREEFK